MEPLPHRAPSAPPPPRHGPWHCCPEGPELRVAAWRAAILAGTKPAIGHPPPRAAAALLPQGWDPPWPAGSGRGNRPAPAGRGTPRPCRARAAGGWRPRRAGRTAGRRRSWPPRSRRPQPAPCRLRAGRDGAALPGRGERRPRAGREGARSGGDAGPGIGGSL